MKFKEGDAAVYVKTGTKGRIVQIHELEGRVWLELDSTGLLYEEDTLDPTPQITAKEPTEIGEPLKSPKEGESEKAISCEKERIQKDEIHMDTSGSCSGGG